MATVSKKILLQIMLYSLEALRRFRFCTKFCSLQKGRELVISWNTVHSSKHKLCGGRRQVTCTSETSYFIISKLYSSLVGKVRLTLTGKLLKPRLSICSKRKRQPVQLVCPSAAHGMLAEGRNRRETEAKKQKTNKNPNNKPGKKMEIAQIFFANASVWVVCRRISGFLLACLSCVFAVSVPTSTVCKFLHNLRFVCAERSPVF